MSTKKRSAADLEAAIVRLADGDRSAFSSVFAQLWPVVRGFCAKALSADDADDAAQATMLKLFGRVGEYDPQGSARGWALAIAAWECRSIERRGERRKTKPLAHTEQLAGGDRGPEEELARKELSECIRAAIAELPPGDRATLLAVLEEEGGGTKRSAQFRKRKQRALTRLRGVWRRLYGY